MYTVVLYMIFSESGRHSHLNCYFWGGTLIMECGFEKVSRTGFLTGNDITCVLHTSRVSNTLSRSLILDLICYFISSSIVFMNTVSKFT